MTAAHQPTGVPSPSMCVVCRGARPENADPQRPVCTRIECQTRYHQSLSRPTDRCRRCGVFLKTPLEIRQRQCDREACGRQTPTHDRGSTEADYLESLTAQARRLEEQSGTISVSADDSSRLPVFVPFLDRVLMPLDSQRIDEFRDAVRELVDRCFALSPEPPHELPDEDHGLPLAPPVAARAGRACGTCRGWCCSNARHTHAYLDVSTVQRFRYHHPDATADSILDGYLSHLAEQPFAESCVYHAETGCVLPQPLRSSVCNRFLCHGLQDLVDRLTADPSVTPLLAAVAGTSVRNVHRLT